MPTRTTTAPPVVPADPVEAARAAAEALLAELPRFEVSSPEIAAAEEELRQIEDEPESWPELEAAALESIDVEQMGRVELLKRTHGQRVKAARVKVARARLEHYEAQQGPIREAAGRVGRLVAERDAAIEATVGARAVFDRPDGHASGAAHAVAQAIGKARGELHRLTAPPQPKRPFASQPEQLPPILVRGNQIVGWGERPEVGK